MIGAMEWKQTTVVRGDGRIEVAAPPPFRPGEVVEVSVRPGAPTGDSRPPPRRPGSARGRVRVRPDFDAPLPDFGDYT